MMSGLGTVTIRELRADDVSWLPPVIEAFGYVPPRNLSDLIGKVLNCPEAKCFVAECDGRPMGYALTVRRLALCFENAPLWLEEISISREATGRGIGSLLLEHCQAYARQIGAKQLVLTNRKVRESYQRQFYAKRGFKEQETAVFARDVGEQA